MTSTISSYALIGDLETVALVGRNGSIDWLCWPRFDSDSVFTAILGDAENGRWLIAPAEAQTEVRRRYKGNTLILETEFSTPSGTVTVTDLMPLRTTHSDLIRIVEGKEGEVAMRMDLVIRFGYGKVVPWVRRLERKDDGDVLVAVAGPDMAVLRSPVATKGEGLHTCADFTVRAGETRRFVLSYGESHKKLPEPLDIDEAVERTTSFWTDWAARGIEELDLAATLGDAAEQAVVRSLITLKALTYAPTGGIVAAPTTSLPEELGGERNWDYRYCWLRDATLTLLAFMDAGYFEEAEAWRDWLLRAAAGSPDQVQIMYGIGGERRLNEWEVPWLAGYEKSQPVRIGNAAYDQMQHDVFGEVMDVLYQARLGGLPKSEAGWALQRALIDRLAGTWRETDSGIWEVRSEPKHFTYSKIMSWVAVDRCIRSAEELGRDGPVDEWRRLRDEIREDVCANGYNDKVGAFVQSYDNEALDASLLLIPTLGFLPSSDPRYISTVEAVERGLSENGLIHRYDTDKTDDGLEGHEGAFFACSFWLADAYAMTGRLDEARELFDRLLGYANDVGLMSEEYDPETGRELGNFPQAFSHLALIHTALRLARRVSGDERKPIGKGSSERALNPAARESAAAAS